MSEQEKSLETVTIYKLDNPKSLEDLAAELATYIKDKKLSKQIRNEQYVYVEGWQYAGGRLGIVPIIRETKNLTIGSTFKYWAKCELLDMHSGTIVGCGEAICSKQESKKKTFDEYAILSMAQTRSIGKAYRNLLGWLMKSAGFTSTPLEEMDEVAENDELPPIPKIDDSKKKWIDAGTPDFYEAVGYLCNGYTIPDLRNKWKVSREIEKLLDEAVERSFQDETQEVDEDTLTMWKDTLLGIDTIEDLTKMFESEKSKIESVTAIMTLFTARRKEIEKKKTN